MDSSNVKDSYNTWANQYDTDINKTRILKAWLYKRYYPVKTLSLALKLDVEPGRIQAGY